MRTLTLMLAAPVALVLALVGARLAPPVTTAAAQGTTLTDPLPGWDRDAAPANDGTTLGDLRDLQDKVRQTVDRVTPAVVGLRAGPSQGSGVIVDPDGTIMTAGHVAGAVGTVHDVIFPDGSRARGQTTSTNAELDSGLVKLQPPQDADGYPYVPVGRADAMSPGDWTIALGHPGGYMQDRPPVVRVGRLLTLGRRLFATDNTLVGGDSGGPLFDLDGNVVGIHSRIGESLQANLHVPSERFPQGPFLGVIGDQTNRVCRIERVYPDSAAERAGLREGDVITRLDGRPIGGLEQLVNLLSVRQPGDRVRVEYRRPGVSGLREVTVTLGGRPVPAAPTQRRRR